MARPEILRTVGRMALFAAALAVMSGAAAHAEAGKPPKPERYTPAIWIDPDGCEHWVMDDGAEGYMDIRLDRNGKPVCHAKIATMACGEMPSDLLFASGSATIGADGKRRLAQFFKSAAAKGYAIVGHTDAVAGDAYNRALSERRARAVAAIAQSVGAKVTSVKGAGESRPKATNATAAGRAANRRVEIFCNR